MNYRVVFQSGGFTMGDSETWVTPDYTPAQLIAALGQVLPLRAAMMLSTDYFQGVRIGRYIAPSDNTGQRRRSVLLPPGSQFYTPAGVQLFVPPTGTLPISALNSTREMPYRNALQVQVTFDTDRTANKYIAGVPNLIFTGESGGYQKGADPKFDDALFAYFSWLVDIGKWLVSAKDRTAGNPPYYIQFIRQEPQAPGRLGLIFQGNAPAWTGGTRVELQGFRPPKGTRNPTLNGTWYIDAQSTSDFPGLTVFYLRNSSAITPAMVNFTDKTHVYKYLYTTYQVQGMWPIRVAWHKRGKPATAPRGRVLKRGTLDP